MTSPKMSASGSALYTAAEAAKHDTRVILQLSSSASNCADQRAAAAEADLD